MIAFMVNGSELFICTVSFTKIFGTFKNNYDPREIDVSLVRINVINHSSFSRLLLTPACLLPTYIETESIAINTA